MLSQTKIYYLLLMMGILLFSSCDSKKDNASEEQRVNYNDPAIALDIAKKKLEGDIKFAYYGKFEALNGNGIVSGIEVSEKEEWGIIFAYLKEKENQFQKAFHTDLLKGSFAKSLTNKIKFSFIDYELIYYNSQDYFLGSSGGEIFSYLIDINKKETYYAHLFFPATFSGKKQAENFSLYISPNTTNEELKSFFISNFKRDFPKLEIVSKDYDYQ